MGTRPFFYGWIVLGVSTLALVATSPGQTFLVQTFYASLREALALDARELGFAYMLGTLLAALPQTFLGRMSDRFGPRRAMTAIAAGFGGACLFMGSVQGVVTLTVGFLMLRLLGQGALGVVSGHSIAMWFERRLGTVEGIRVACFFAAMAGMPVASLALIDAYGWRTAWVILGVAIWTTILPAAAFLMRDRPEDMGQEMDGGTDPEAPPPRRPEVTGGRDFRVGEAASTRVFWLLVSVLFAYAMIITGIVFHLQPLFAAAGLSREETGVATATLGIVSAVTTLGGGYLADRLRPRLMFAIAAGLLAAGCFVLARAASPFAAGMAFAVFGVGHSLVVVAGSPTYARYFGRLHHGAIRGLVATLMVGGTSAGPLLFANLSSEAPGGFSAVLDGCGVACLPLALAAWTIRPPSDGRRS